MSAEVRIHCDGQPGGKGTKCLTSVGGILPWHTTATKIRRFWRNEGWHRTSDGRDICPKCWAENIHRGQTSSDWCTECEERKPCGCDGWKPLPGEDLGEGEWDGPDWTSPPPAESEAAA